MKTPETIHDQQKAQRRQQFLKRLQDERGAQPKPRRAEVETTPPVRRRNALAEALAAEHSPALLRKQLREQKLLAQQTETQRALREKELLSSTLQKQQEQRQGELRATVLRKEQRRVQQNAAEQARRDEELRAAARQEQQVRQQAEQRAAELRAKQRRVQQTAADQALEQAARAAEARKAQRRVQQPEGAQGFRNEEIRSEDIHAAELRDAQAREEQRRSQQAEATQARLEEHLRATTLREQRTRQQRELRAAELQQERCDAQGATDQVFRDERLQAAELREKQKEHRLAEREHDAAAAQIVEKERQEEALRLQAGAQRAPVRDRQLETAPRHAQDKAQRVRVARNQIRLALAPVTPRGMRSALTEHVEPEPLPATLPYLSTSASLLVDENNEPVSLRGVTVRGLDTVVPAPEQTFSAALALDDSNLLQMTDRWGVNLVRLAFQAQTILSGNGNVSAPAMLTGLDATVSAITKAGACVLLALEAPPAASGTPLTPDASTTQAWQTLASRYQSESRVLYEIFASPSPLAANWLQSAATLVDSIRQQNPTSIIFLGSGRGGSDTTGLPLRSQNGEPVSNLVYTIAVSAQSLPNPDDGHFRALAESYPVFASMWSDDGSDMGRLSSRVADLFGRFGVGWAASTWNADSPLVADAANHDFTPTGWGLIAQRALSLSAVISFKPAAAASNIFTFRGSALHQLKTVGSFVIDENNNPVSLRGVTVRGLDSVTPASDQTFPAALALDDGNLLEMTERWGVNLIRLPFQTQTVLAGNGSISAASILGGLDVTVAAITEAGAYVLLALEAPLADAGTRINPDNSVSQVWQLLAERYKAHSGVLCELFSSSPSLSPNWPQVASTLVATIRQRKPLALIFVGSGNGGSDVSGLPFLSANGDPMFNLVYTIAVSPEIPPNVDDGKLAALAQSNPIFASLWSDGGSDFGRSSSRVPDLFDRYGIGWAASSWNAEPNLVVDAASHDFTATGWGRIAARAFRLPAKLLLKPFGL